MGEEYAVEPVAPATIGGFEVVEGENLDIAAPSPVQYQPKGPPMRRIPMAQRLEYKRTIIPVMLTLGVAMPLLATMAKFSSPDSILAAFGGTLGLVFYAVGALLLALAVFTMLSVKHLLDMQAARQAAQNQGPGPRS